MDKENVTKLEPIDYQEMIEVVPTGGGKKTNNQ